MKEMVVAKTERHNSHSKPEHLNNHPTPDTQKDHGDDHGDIATILGVAPCDTTSNTRRRKRAYFWFRHFLALSQLCDPLHIPNSCVNLQCVWWKSLAGNDATSPVHDGGLTFDLLPPLTRWAVAPAFAPQYPRFHHANVELRTRFLDVAMDRIIKGLTTPTTRVNNDMNMLSSNHNHNPNSATTIEETTATTAPNNTASANQKGKKKKIRLVLLGGGYDLRLIRTVLAQQSQEQQNSTAAPIEWDLVDVDLPHVIHAKQQLFRQRLLRRRPSLKPLIDQIRFFEADLNDLERVQQVVDEILDFNNNNNNNSEEDWYTIFVFEAVMIYLQPGVPAQCLQRLSDALQSRRLRGALCFADTLPINSDNTANATTTTTTNTTTTTTSSNNDDATTQCKDVNEELERCGWFLVDWMLKPGRTRHLVWADLKAGG